jgi:hypothetical protein
MPSSNPPTFAARSIPQTPFDHKIHLQNHFSRKFQPRFNFYSQKVDFTGNHALVHLRDLKTHPADKDGFIGDAGRMGHCQQKISSGT